MACLDSLIDSTPEDYASLVRVREGCQDLLEQWPPFAERRAQLLGAFEPKRQRSPKNSTRQTGRRCFCPMKDSRASSSSSWDFDALLQSAGLSCPEDVSGEDLACGVPEEALPAVTKKLQELRLQEEKPQEKTQEKTHRCSRCGSEFNLRKTLQMHLKVCA
jgi:hypothetical protein